MGTPPFPCTSEPSGRVHLDPPGRAARIGDGHVTAPVVVDPLASNRISVGEALTVAPPITASETSGGRFVGHVFPAGVPSVQMVWRFVLAKITRTWPSSRWRSAARSGGSPRPAPPPPGLQIRDDGAEKGKAGRREDDDDGRHHHQLGQGPPPAGARCATLSSSDFRKRHRLIDFTSPGELMERDDRATVTTRLGGPGRAHGGVRSPLSRVPKWIAPSRGMGPVTICVDRMPCRDRSDARARLGTPT